MKSASQVGFRSRAQHSMIVFNPAPTQRREDNIDGPEDMDGTLQGTFQGTGER